MDIERWLDAQSELVGLPIAPEHRPGVVRYLQLVATLAPAVTAFELSPADEPANVFEPVAAPARPREAGS